LRYLSATVDRGDVPGVVALVVDREGVLYQASAGKLNVALQVKMPADALVRIASMTKPVTSVAVMMLVDAGKVGLDDPVSKFLPEFENRQVISTFNAADGSYDTRPASRTITIRHLLTHTSGLGYAWGSNRRTSSCRVRRRPRSTFHCCTIRERVDVAPAPGARLVVGFPALSRSSFAIGSSIP
jgi:CubicO group peptidase (beta-lactamase class C family)